MIKMHPKPELLQAFVKGELPTTLSAAISAHTEMCSCCQKTVSQLTQSFAQSAFDSSADTTNSVQPMSMNEISDSRLMDMFDTITADDCLDDMPLVVPKTIQVKDNAYTLPRSLQNVELGSWLKLGKLSRSKVMLDDGSLHSHILHIEKGGEVPSHTHKGFELTLLLDGSFEDEMGTYQKGDFIWLDRNHTHQPFTQEGCLCLTVADDALQFTQGLSKLLNPIGSLIY